MNFPNRPAELLLSLGNLQVFWFPTEEDITNNVMPNTIFWRDLHTMNTYGPFDTVYQATSHYTWLVDQQKPSKTAPKPDAEVIFVDFLGKRRVKYALPGEEK